MKYKHQTKHPQKIIWRPHVDIRKLAGEHLSLVLPGSSLLLYCLLQLQYQLPKCNSGTARGPLGNCMAPPEKMSSASVSVLFEDIKGVCCFTACLISPVLTYYNITALHKAERKTALYTSRLYTKIHLLNACTTLCFPLHVILYLYFITYQ